MIYAEPVNPIGNGADDTTAIQSSLVEGVETYVLPPIEGGYTTGPLTIPTSLRRLVFESTVYQRAADEIVFTGTGLHDLTIYDPKVRGIAGLNETVSSANDIGFKLKGNSKNVEFRGGEISRFRGPALWAEQGEDIRVIGTRSIETNGHLRFRGVNKVLVHNVTIARSCLAPTLFTVGLGFDSTDGHAFGLCSNIDVRGCRIEDLGYSQGVLHHGGGAFKYQDCVFRNCAVGLSLNPYNTQDFINSGIISGNQIWGLNPGVYTSGIDHGIVMNAGPMAGGGPLTPYIQDVVLADNAVYGVNRTRLDYTVGGFHFGWTRGLHMEGNLARGCGGSGMTVVGPMDAMNVVGFSSLGHVEAGGERNGARIMAECTGRMTEVLNENNTVGIRFGGNPSWGLDVGAVTMIGGGGVVYGR